MAMPLPELVKNVGACIEETRVTPMPEFPAKVVFEFLRADGELCQGVFSPMQAHKASDDLLRAAAAAMRKGPGDADAAR